MIETGSKVVLNGKYEDRRDLVGKVMTVTHVGDICGKKCAWVDEPKLCGGYALDGFDEVKGGDAS